MKIGYLMQAGVPDIRQHPLSGPANHVKQVFTELHKLGHQIRLLAFIDGAIWQSDNLEDFERVSLPLLDKKLMGILESAVRRVQSEFHLPYAALFESLRFAEACQQVLSGYDVFYERMGWVGYGGVLAASRLKIPLVLEVNGDHLSEMEMLGMAPQGAQRRLSIWLTKRALNRVSYVVAAGEGWRNRFVDRWNFPPDKVTVIENGSEIVNMLDRDQLRAFSALASSEATTIIYIGAFEPWHGLSVLVDAVANAISKGIALRLVLVGAGLQEAIIRQMIFNLGIADHVIFTGLLSPHEFAPYLTNADIGVSPYCGRVEFSGLKLLDYKSAGLAVIASGENGQPAVLKHGLTGWVVPPCDKEALCDAIVHLAMNTDLRHRIGRQARLDAENYHSWRYTAERLEQLFSKVVAASSV